MTRLRKLKKLENKTTNKIKKTAAIVIDLENEMLGSGDTIGLLIREVNKQPWYQVYLEHDTGASSFYDGPDSSRAFDMYRDLLLAFKGVRAAEEFVKRIPKHEKQLEMFKNKSENKGLNDYYHNLILKRPSFLGYF